MDEFTEEFDVMTTDAKELREAKETLTKLANQEFSALVLDKFAEDMKVEY